MLSEAKGLAFQQGSNTIRALFKDERFANLTPNRTNSLQVDLAADAFRQFGAGRHKAALALACRSRSRKACHSRLI